MVAEPATRQTLWKLRTKVEDNTFTQKTGDQVRTKQTNKHPFLCTACTFLHGSFSRDGELEELVLNTAPGDLPRSFYTAQHPVRRRAAVAMLLVNSCWPGCLAGIAKKVIAGKHCLFIAYLSAGSCLTSLEIAGFNSHVCRDRF